MGKIIWLLLTVWLIFVILTHGSFRFPKWPITFPTRLRHKGNSCFGASKRTLVTGGPAPPWWQCRPLSIPEWINRLMRILLTLAVVNTCEGGPKKLEKQTTPLRGCVGNLGKSSAVKTLFLPTGTWVQQSKLTEADLGIVSWQRFVSCREHWPSLQFIFLLSYGAQPLPKVRCIPDVPECCLRIQCRLNKTSVLQLTYNQWQAHSLAVLESFLMVVWHLWTVLKLVSFKSCNKHKNWNQGLPCWSTG